MLPYWILVLVPLILSLFTYNIRKNSVLYKLPVITFFVIWLLILVFRDISVGTDLEAYEYMFYENAKCSFSEILHNDIEIGYALYSKIIYLLSHNYNIFIAITALVSVLPVFYLYYKETESPLLSIVLFLVIAPFSMFFSGLRQSMAMAFIVPVLFYTQQKRLLPFLITVFIAYQFHISSIIMLFVYPLYYLKLDKKWMSILLAVGGLIFLMKNTVFIYLLGFAGERYSERYGEIEETGAIMVFILLLLMLIYSFIIPDNKKEDAELIGLRNILLIATYIQIFASLNPIVMRMNYYFLLIVPLLISKVTNRSSNSLKNLTNISVCIMNIYFIYYYFQSAYYGADILNVYPYKSCLNF